MGKTLRSSWLRHGVKAHSQAAAASCIALAACGCQTPHSGVASQADSAFPTTVVDGCRATATGISLFGNRYLDVVLGWVDGVLKLPDGYPYFADGSRGIKVAWDRKVRGRLSVQGRRLDAEAPALRAWIPTGYGEIGPQSTMVIFPTAGCWEVTGSVEGHSLTFVTLVRFP